MTPVIHCSIASLNLFPRTTFVRRREFHITRCSVSKNYIRPSSSSQRFLSCQLSPQFFQIYRNGCGPYHGSRVQIIAAVGTDVTVEESNSVVSGEDADEPSETASRSPEASENVRTTPATTSAKSKRTRPARKSEMPPVKNEELVPGATFTGKVRSIQPFGAFVDFGAFTDGLVHVSRMSDGYVKDVGALVSVGQEVKVRIVEANMESGRISLSMRDSDDVRKPQQRKEASSGGNNEKQRPTRKTAARSTQKRDDVQKTSKFVKGQILDGTVKNITRSGAFVSLPEGEEGFLPVSEESEGFGNILGNSSLQVGQEVNVRVLRISRGQATLTMKKEEDVEKLNMQLSQGVVHVATNPFELAFRKNEDIAAFLDEQEKIQKSSESSSLSKTSKEKEGKLDEITKKSDSAEVESSLTDSIGNQVGVSSATGLELEDEKTSSQEQHEEAPITDSSSVELVSNVDEPVSSSTPDSIGVTESLAEETSSIPEAGMGDDEEPVITSAENTKLVPETLAGEDESSTTSIGSSSDTVPEEASVAEDIKASHSATDIVEEQIISSNASVSEGSESATDGLSSSLAKDEISVTSEVNEEVSNSESYVADEVSVSDEARETDGTIGTVPEEDVSSADSVSTTDSVASKDSLEVNGTSSSTGSSREIKEEPTSVEGASSEKIVTSQSNGPSLDDKVGDGTTIPVENEMVSDDSKDGISVTSEGNEEVSNPESYVTDEVSVSDEVRETDGTIGTVPEEDVSSAESVSTTDSVASKDSLEVNGNSSFTGSSGEIKEEPTSVEGVSSEKIVTSQSNGPSVDDKVEDGTTIPVENKMAPDDSKDVKVEVMETSDRQTGSAQGSETKATISPALVKQLREETGAGMMDCKKALAETGGDIVKAQEFLRKKGLASADKKASRATAEGRIGSYIHDNRIGVLIEVNCETDFVSRGEIFKELVDDLAMQVAACPQVRYLVTEDVPEEIVNKEREIEMQKEDLLTKPEQIRSKIVDGRIRKRLEEFALLEQPYIKNDKMVVKDWVKQTIATVGENIKVRRFVRYNLGEGLEKKSQDFAAEVAAQTAAKPSPAAPKNQSAEAKEPVQIAPTVAISAALVKQLREETGAGMMDCKKALTETGGDLEKAQEYLRKKGLSSADKKSSRLAAEGRISSYIHDSCIGALIEVNSETDFVGRNERFKELVDDLAMQIVACPQVEFVSIEDIPESIMNKEKEMEMQREDLQSKPENIREKIVAGRISKRLGELALLEQPFIKDDSMLVKDLVKQTVAALGENIKVRRFVRFTLGENKA